MFRRFKKLSAFITGCLASTVIFGYPSQLLAQTNTLTDPIQGVTSTTQSPPSNAAEIADAITGINAGLTPIDVGGFSPDPIREHTAFLSSMWNVLFQSEYSVENSTLISGQWITGPIGALSAVNENNQSVSIDIGLSLEILPEEFGYTPEDLVDLTEYSARFGIAWTTMSTTEATSNILIWWIEWDGPDGFTSRVGPLSTVEQSDNDLIRTIVPLMGDFFDNPLNYNIDSDSSPLSLWSTFRERVSSSVINGIGAVVGTVTTAAIIAGASFVNSAIAAAAAGTAAAAVGPVVIAVAVAAGTAVGAGLIIVLTIAEAYDQLLADLEAAGFDTSSMTREEIEAAARSLGLELLR